MPTANPIAPTTENNIAEIDPMLEAIAQVLRDSDKLPEFTDGSGSNVIPCEPEVTAEELENRIKRAVAKNRGLCLLIVAGGGKNTDESAPGPRMKVSFELQLFASPLGKLRPKESRPVLALVTAIMRVLHNGQLGDVVGCPWYEYITIEGFEPVPDEDFTAYVITASRDMQL